MAYCRPFSSHTHTPHNEVELAIFVTTLLAYHSAVHPHISIHLNMMARAAGYVTSKIFYVMHPLLSNVLLYFRMEEEDEEDSRPFRRLAEQGRKNHITWYERQIAKLAKAGKVRIFSLILTLPMLRLLSSKAQGCKDFWKPYKPCHVGIHLIALAEYYQMNTHCQGFCRFSGFLHHFVLAKLATSSIRV